MSDILHQDWPPHFAHEVFMDLESRELNEGIWPNGAAPGWAKDIAKALSVGSGSVHVDEVAYRKIAECLAKIVEWR